VTQHCGNVLDVQVVWLLNDCIEEPKRTAIAEANKGKQNNAQLLLENANFSDALH